MKEGWSVDEDRIVFYAKGVKIIFPDDMIVLTFVSTLALVLSVCALVW